MGDVLIDDGPHNLVNGPYFRILFDQPHNRGIDEKKYGQRCLAEHFSIKEAEHYGRHQKRWPRGQLR